jgi:hypothetical protein
MEVHNRSNKTILVAKYGLKWPTEPENQLPIASGASMRVAIAEKIGIELIPILGMFPAGISKSSSSLALVCEDDDKCMNLRVFSLPKQVIDYSNAWQSASMLQQMLDHNAGSVVFNKWNDVRFYELDGKELIPPKEEQ